jgi:hypothetical protein
MKKNLKNKFLKLSLMKKMMMAHLEFSYDFYSEKLRLDE